MDRRAVFTLWRPAAASPLAGHATAPPWFSTERVGYAAIFGFGSLLFWLSATRPSLLPAWAPWDFSSVEYLATALSLFWFGRGIAMLPNQDRPSFWRRVAFIGGVLAMYAVLQTHFDYMAQHMFFLNRVQHVVMHHIGPFLVAIGGGGASIRRGMPAALERACRYPIVTGILRVLQQPFVAVVLFVGLFYLWLIPAVHFRAMISPALYAVMNWSMVADGVLFWVLILDPRPSPPARVSFFARAAMAFATTFPEIIIGVCLTSAQRDLYPSYALCGRLFPSMSAIADQHIGGIVVWVPPAMMSAGATLIALSAFFRHEDEMISNVASDA